MKVIGYARLSKQELRLECPSCPESFNIQNHQAADPEFHCPHCGATIESDRQPHSIKSQTDRITDYVRYKFPTVTDFQIMWEVCSATTEKFRDREYGKKACDELEYGDHLVVVTLDRVWRSNMDFVLSVDWLKNAGITLHLIDLGLDLSTPAGEIIGGMFAIMAQNESRMSSERTKAALAWRKNNNLPYSGTAAVGTEYICNQCGNRHSRLGRSCAKCNIIRVGNTLVRPCLYEHMLGRFLIDMKAVLSWNEVIKAFKHFKIKTKNGVPLSKDNSWPVYNWARNSITGAGYSTNPAQLQAKVSRKTNGDDDQKS